MCFHSMCRMKFSYCFSERITPIGFPLQTMIPSLTRPGIRVGIDVDPARQVLAVEQIAELRELFPVRLPLGGGHPGANGGLLEIARVREEPPVFAPIRWNLVINCSGALVLMLAVMLIRMRLRDYLRGRALGQQVEIARQVQQNLLPGSRPVPEHVELSAECAPAASVGGDFYDVFRTEDGRIATLLGDVSGKGLPAALLMGVIHGAVRSMDWTGSVLQHEEASRRLNALLCDRASSERYASMFWAYFDPGTRRLHYINAGHCSPLLVSTHERKVRVEALSQGGPVLGLIPFAGYQQASVPYQENDLLVMYSDGVVEAANAKGEEFGEQRLRQVIEEHAGSAPETLRESILNAVRQFVGNAAPHDDLTLMVVRFTPAEKQAASLRGTAHTEELATA
jgi:serine phosphatase RsbU (regulator of sigma subunit)